jgi:hypothetical protein
MKSLPRVLLTGLAAVSMSLPSVAHMTSSEAPHVHAGDGWGLLVIAVLTGIAAWLGRRGR